MASANTNVVCVDVERAKAGGDFNVQLRERISEIGEALTTINGIFDSITNEAIPSGAVHDSLVEFFGVIKSDLTSTFTQEFNNLVVGWELLATHVDEANNK